MAVQLTRESRRILASAAVVARRFNHDYVGTEHVLMALVENPTDVIRDAITAVDVDAEKIRAQLERLVGPGTEPVAVRRLPLSPRVKRAIEYAREESLNGGAYCVAPECLLLGLLREMEGFAYQMLLSSSINLQALRTQLRQVRLTQMKVVERVIRPLRASISRKRTIREELLAHMSAIYDQERAKSADREVALQNARERFGDPAELRREIQSSIPYCERFNYLMERQLQYRAPESAAHFAYRIALITLILLVPILGLTTLGVTLRYGWTIDVQSLARVMSAIAILTPITQFAIWITYIGLRNALWGAFESPRSKLRTFGLTLCIGVVTLLYLWAIDVSAKSRPLVERILDTNLIGVAFLTAVGAYMLARVNGPIQIRDTKFALLDLDVAE